MGLLERANMSCSGVSPRINMTRMLYRYVLVFPESYGATSQHHLKSHIWQVLNASGQQVGHIPRTVAFKVAGLMDSAVITVEGKMVGQNLDKAHHYKLAMDMSIYTRPSHRAVLELELAWATPGGRGFEHMRTAQQSDKSNCQYKDPRFEGRGQVMGGEIGLNRMGSVGRAEEMRNLLEGLRKIGEDEKHAEDVMVGSTR